MGKYDNQPPEIADFLEALGINDEWVIENIKETAMNRFCVRKTRRKHIKRILDEAFNLLLEEGS